MKSKKIDSNTPEPRKVSLLENIVFGIEAGAMDDPPTPTTPKAKPRKRTAPKVRTKRNDPETEKQYKRWARKNDPDQAYKRFDTDEQCKKYRRKYGD